MAINDDNTYYDILDLKPDASPGEVREAYLRTKATYNKDSVALYTLISSDEREDMLRKIEEAYEVLSSTERRREYDRHHGLLSVEEELAALSRHMPSKKIISIDRVPPMDAAGSSENMLVAPSTDFTGGANAATSDGDSFFGATEAPLPVNGQGTGPTAGGQRPPSLAGAAHAANHAPGRPGQAGPPHAPLPGVPGAAPSGTPSPAAARASAAAALGDEIAKEAEWHGSFIRRVREIRRVSVEELSAVTKITKTYIQAIEEENFGRLPAAVYLRGFIIQIAKVLKLPHEKVAGGYMARYYQARPDQAR